MNSKEKELVTEDFCLSKDNYNLCVGGQGGFSYINRNNIRGMLGKSQTNKQKEAARNFMIKNNLDKIKHRETSSKGGKHSSGMKGKNHSFETLQKMRGTRTQSSKDKNSQYGTMWITDGKINKKIKKEDIIPEGWYKGRTPKTETKCEVCGSLTGSYMARFCDKHRLEHKNTYSYKGGESYRKRKNNEDKEKFTYAITSSKTWREAIKKAGFKTDGYSRTRLQRFAKENNISLMAD